MPDVGTSWTALDADDDVVPAVPVQANGLVFSALNTGTQDESVGFRHGDSADNWNNNLWDSSHFQATIGINDANVWHQLQGAGSIDVYIAAYTQHVTASASVAPGETKTLTFVATGNLNQGNYTNQAAAELTVLQGGCRASGITAPIDVGGGTSDPKKIVFVSKDVDPTQAPSFETTTFTYTITAAAMSGAPSLTIDDIFDVLPKSFDYAAGSSLLDGSPIADPTITMDPPGDPDNDWQTLQWDLNTPFGGADTATLEFQATANVDSGYRDNEAWITTLHNFFPCVASGQTARVTISAKYDILVTAGDATVVARITEVGGEVTVDSMQYQ